MSHSLSRDALEQIQRQTPDVLSASWQYERDGQIHTVALQRSGTTLNTILGLDQERTGLSGLVHAVVEQSAREVPNTFTGDGVEFSLGTRSWFLKIKPATTRFDLAGLASTLTLRVAVEARSTWLRRLARNLLRRAAVQPVPAWAAAGYVVVVWYLYELIVDGASQGTWVLTSGRRFGSDGGSGLKWWTFVGHGRALPPGG